MLSHLTVFWITVVAAGCNLRNLSADKSSSTINDAEAMAYLSRYGYLPELGDDSHPHNSAALLHPDAWEEAIKEFQVFAGLSVTGELDNQTMSMMKRPRCGVKDKIGTGNNRSKRYALQGSRWKVKNLKYIIEKYPAQGLKRYEVDNAIRLAFSVWSEHTDLTFTQVNRSDQAHITILFARGAHGDGDPFDGPGGTLAHAYFPVYGGDAHFDKSENWTVNSYRGTNLLQVAAHEFGHSLGLSHSDVKAALMAPFYRGYYPSFLSEGLHEDDKRGIQKLYGKKSKYPVPTPPPPKPYPPADDDDHDDDDDAIDDSGSDHRPGGFDVNMCRNARIDTIFKTTRGDTFVFRGDLYYKLLDDGVAPGYPRPIRGGWPGLPGGIDAAFTHTNGKTYFFRGRHYWRYTNRTVDGNYPKLIADGFPGIPNHVDAALVWGGNSKLYFFKGTQFWRYNPAEDPPVKATYPKLVANWDGVPDNMDAAFTWTNGYTYFFKGDGYYRFNDVRFQVDSAKPAFPRSLAVWWLGCKRTAASVASLQMDTSETKMGDPVVNPDTEDFTVEDSDQQLEYHQRNHAISNRFIPLLLYRQHQHHPFMGFISIKLMSVLVVLTVLSLLV